MATVDPDARPQLARHVRMRFDKSREQYVLLSPEKVWMINDTGAQIIELCNGQRTVAEVEAELGRTYDQITEGEVAQFVAEMVTKNGMEINRG